MLKRLGIAKYVLLIVFAIGTVVTSAVLLNWWSQKINANYVSTSFHDVSVQTKTSSEILSSISQLQATVPGLFNERDVDILEGQIKKISDITEKIKKQIAECSENCLEYEGVFKSYSAEVQAMINDKLLLGKNAEAIEHYITKICPLYLNIIDISRLQNQKVIDEILQKESNINLNNENQTTYALIFGALVTLIVGVLGLSLKNNIQSALIQTSDSLVAITQAVTDASSHIGVTGHNLDSATKIQDQAIGATSQALGEFSENLKSSERLVKDSEKSSKMSLEQIELGKNALNAMIHLMQRIKKSSSDTSDLMVRNDVEFQKVVNLIKQIDEKTKVINEIVFQTKLLSFNASVEAARAGEHGKGFAVVAEEVGNLATMSGNAAKEISSLLQNGVLQVEEIAKNSKSSSVVLLQEGAIAVDEGHAKAQECFQAFDGIVTQAQQVQTSLTQIEKVVEEQTTEISHINLSMQKVDEVAKQNGISSKQSLDLAQVLNAKSTELNELTDMLDQLILGSKRFKNKSTTLANQKQIDIASSTNEDQDQAAA